MLGILKMKTWEQWTIAEKWVTTLSSAKSLLKFMQPIRKKEGKVTFLKSKKEITQSIF